MNAVFDLSWRAVPATALLIGGVLLFVTGVRAMIQPLRAAIRRSWIRGFRRMALGFGLACAALGWLWQLPWLLAIGLAVGAEETYETSWILAYWPEPKRAAPARVSPAAAPSAGACLLRRD